MISVVIPCRSDALGLWFTVSSALSDLESSGLDFEIIPVLNGGSPDNGWTLHKHPSVHPYITGAHVSSPQAARHFGFMESSGDPVFFLDSHVVVPPGFFKQVLQDIEDSGADFLGIGHKFDGGQMYAARVDWDEYLWQSLTASAAPSADPFPVAVHPHGAFAVKHDAYIKAGGYWLALKGFGGEETQLCLKFWMMGLTCFATPRTYHWHWLPPAARRGAETFRDYNFVHNFLLIAAAYGDEGQVERSYEAIRRRYWGTQSLYPMLAEYVSRDPAVAIERATIASWAKYKTLADLRKMFHEYVVLN